MHFVELRNAGKQEKREETKVVVGLEGENVYHFANTTLGIIEERWGRSGAQLRASQAEPRFGAQMRCKASGYLMKRFPSKTNREKD